MFLSDVWRSSSGRTWRRITAPAYHADSGYPRFDVPFPGRGGHQMLVLTLNGDSFLYVFGGLGGDNSVNGGPEEYYNDIWRASLKGNSPASWERVDNGSTPWSPRAGHAVAFMEATPGNGRERTVFLYGGRNNRTYHDDLWAWRVGEESVTTWRLDFTADAYYSTGSGDDLNYNQNSPAQYYVTPDSPLHMMQRYWVPAEPGKRGKSHERCVKSPSRC